MTVFPSGSLDAVALSGVEDDALLLEGEREELAEQILLLRAALTEKETDIAALEADIAGTTRFMPSMLSSRPTRFRKF